MLKKWFTQKWKFAEKFTHPQAIQDKFASSLEQNWRNVALHYHIFTVISSAVNGCRQNKRLNSWLKTKQFTSKPHESSPSINIVCSEKLHVYKKQIHH